MAKKKVVILGFPFIEENKQLAEEIESIVQEKGLEDITHIDQSVDTIEFLKHGVILAPAIIINGERKSAGRIPKREEIKKWLEDLDKSINDAENKLAKMGDKEYKDALESGELDLVDDE